MAATTLTTLVMIIFAMAVIGWALYNLLGDWQPVARRLTHEERVELEFQIAVREMRKAIRDYEQS